MDITVFDERDEPFLNWMTDHDDGYVLNTERRDTSRYACFHRARCSHVSGLASGQRADGFTKYDYIKVCSDDASSLVWWVLANRPNAIRTARLCESCKPKVDLAPLREVGSGGDWKEEVKKLELRPIHRDELVSFVEALEGELLHTKTGKAFTAEITGRGIRFTPKSSGESRYLREAEIQSVLDRFYDIGSTEGIAAAFKPAAHKRRGGGLNASYYLPILKKLLELDKEASVEASDVGDPEEAAEETTARPPSRRRYKVARIIRDSALARRVKEGNQYVCQVCNADPIELRDGALYAEAHHIKPLGQKHRGPDVPSNILCVCPSCHVKLDYGAIRLEKSNLRSVSGHNVGSKYIEYHNAEIWGKA